MLDWDVGLSVLVQQTQTDQKREFEIARAGVVWRLAINIWLSKDPVIPPWKGQKSMIQLTNNRLDWVEDTILPTTWLTSRPWFHTWLQDKARAGGEMIFKWEWVKNNPIGTQSVT